MNLQKQKKGQSCSLVAGSQALSQTQMGIVSPSSQLSPCDTHFQRAQGNMGVESGLQSRCFWLILQARNKTLESWVYLEELRIDVSTVFSFLTGKKCSSEPCRAVWFPKRTCSTSGAASRLSQLSPGRAVTLEDPLLQAAWVLCLLIPIFSPVFSGLQGDCRHNSEEKEE